MVNPLLAAKKASLLTAILLLTAGVFVLVPADAQAPPRLVQGDEPCDCRVEYMLSTGAANGYTADAIGNTDQNWRLVAAPSGVPLGPVYSIDPVPGAWVTAGGANWVNAWRAPLLPQNPIFGNNNMFADLGTYVYEIAFTVDTNGFVGLMLDIQVASDDVGTVALNSAPLSPSTYYTGLTGFTAPITQDQNVLSVTVVNVLTFTGLLVEGGVFGKCWGADDKLNIDLSTGTDTQGVQTIGSLDPDWTMVNSPGAGLDAFSITKHGSWVAIPGANWINPWGDQSYGGVYAPGNNRFDAPAGTYTYEIRFFLPAAAIDYRLDINYSADNSVKLYLNGIYIDGQSSPTTWAASYNHVEVDQTKFNAGGWNTLRAVVTNLDVWTGLIVQGSVQAACDPCHHDHPDDPVGDLPVEAPPVPKLPI